MAENKYTTNHYNLLGGINQKSSEYSVDKAQFLDLRNLDFDVPNALQKRPGSTQAVSVGASGPIRSLFEFQKLTGESYIVAGSDTALFYLAANAYTLIDTGWNNGQPVDMLTFVNKLWAADGARFKSWDGGQSYGVLSAGLPCASNPLTMSVNATYSTSVFYVGGTTAQARNPSATHAIAGVYVAYSYNRADGYAGPADFLSSARQLVVSSADSATDYFAQFVMFGGFTIPTSGISSISVWMAVDHAVLGPDNAALELNGAPKAIRDETGRLGNVVNFGPSAGITSVGCYFFSITLKPTADLAYFRRVATVPGESLIYLSQNGQTMLTYSGNVALSIGTSNFANFTAIASSNLAFTGMNFCWFNSNIPKYLGVNQNVMFYSGFSANPSNVWFSEIGKPEHLEPENFFEVRTNDGDKVLATKAYQGTFLVMKERSFHKVVGDNPSNFQLVELSTQYGCLSNKSVVEFQEDLLWLDKQGILKYNGSAWEIISSPVEDVFRRMNLSAAKEKACAVHYASRNQVWFGIPVDGATENNLTVVFDYLVNAWTFFDGFNASSFAYAKGGLNSPTVFRGDYSGKVHYFGESFFGDNGAGITCLAFTPFDKVTENETWLWRRLFLDCATVVGATGTINVELFKNYNRSSVQKTLSIYQNVFQTRADFGVDGKSVAAKVSHHSGSLPLLINGYSWVKRFLRSV